MIKALYGAIRNLSDPNLISEGYALLTSLTSNRNFPRPTPTMAVLVNLLKGFEAAYKVTLIDPNKLKTLAKNDARNKLLDGFHQLIDYINMVAQGDVVKLDTVVIKLTRQGEHIGILKSRGFTLDDTGIQGELAIDMTAVPRSEGFKVKVRKAHAAGEPHNPYRQMTFSKSKGVISGLESATRYYVEIAVMTAEANDRQEYIWSQEKTRVTQ